MKIICRNYLLLVEPCCCRVHCLEKFRASPCLLLRSSLKLFLTIPNTPPYPTPPLTHRHTQTAPPPPPTHTHSHKTHGQTERHTHTHTHTQRTHTHGRARAQKHTHTHTRARARASCTCGGLVVLEDFTEHQLVEAHPEGVFEERHWNQEHVGVGPFSLVRARPIKVPHWAV